MSDKGSSTTVGKTLRSAMKGGRAAAAASAATTTTTRAAPLAKPKWHRVLQPSSLLPRKSPAASATSSPGAPSSSTSLPGAPSPAAPSSSHGAPASSISPIDAKWRNALRRLPPAKPQTHLQHPSPLSPLRSHPPLHTTLSAATIAALESRPLSPPPAPLYGSMAPTWTSSSERSSRPPHPWAESKRWACCACEAETMVESDVCANFGCKHRRCGGTRGVPVDSEGCFPQDEVEKEKWW